MSHNIDDKQFPLKHSQEKMDEIWYFVDGAIINPTDFDLALVVAAYYNLDIIDYKDKAFPDLVFNNTVVKYSSKMWYYFIPDRHRWIKRDSVDIVDISISTIIVNLFKQRTKHYNALLAKAKDEYLKNIYDAKIKSSTKIVEMLKNTNTKEHLLKEFKHIVAVQNFEEKLDAIKHTLGFNNGVYDFELGAFREGRLDDYISQTVGYDYIEYDPEDEMQKELDTYLAQMYVNPKVRQYVLDVIGVAACCGKIEQFNIFWGDSGANGKSTFMDLLLKTFGNYGKTMPIAFFTQKRASSNAAQPELERLKGSRLAVLSESNQDDILNVGLLKELSGHDRLQARGLFKDPVEFELYAQFILCCNAFPKIPLGSANDGGTWRRLKVIEHSSYFYIDKPPSNIKGKTFFKKDPNICKKIKLFPPYLMSRIINNIQRQYPELEIDIPKEVELATGNYQKENDMFRMFLEENLIMNNERTMDKVNITELYGRFVR
eukprot:765276-Hanusia_phi.AAC.1